MEKFEKLHTEFECVKKQAISTERCLSRCSEDKESVDKQSECKMKCIVEHIPQAVQCFKK